MCLSRLLSQLVSLLVAGQVIGLVADIQTTTNNTATVVNFVFTRTTLLSGRSLSSCQNATDPTCTQGVAAVDAYIRHYYNSTETSDPDEEPILVLPTFDKISQFVQVHPLGWNLNRLVLQGILKWNVYTSSPSLINSDYRDGGKEHLSLLQRDDFPFLLSNVLIPPNNSWNFGTNYHQPIHYDNATKIALIVISSTQSQDSFYCTDYLDSQSQSATGMLEFIKRKNQNEIGNHCLPPTLQEKEKEEELMRLYFDSFETGNYYGDDEHWRETMNTTKTTINDTTATNHSSQNCWIPVILYTHDSKYEFGWFLEEMKSAPYPPAVILDPRGNHRELYREPTPVLATTFSNDHPQHYIWVHSYPQKQTSYFQHQLTLTSDNGNSSSSSPPQQRIEGVTFIERSLKEMPEEFKDETYAQQIGWLRRLADQAQSHDFTIGYTNQVPPQDKGRCNGGQCHIGSLFADAMKSQAETDIAFISSGGLGGPGWVEGPVRISDIWAGLPYPDAICKGTLSGISLRRLLDYSITNANFHNESNTIDYSPWEDGSLLQVSGVRVTYNSKIPRGHSRLVKLEVYNKDLKEWKDVEFFTLYKFATTDHLCTEKGLFPGLLGYYTFDEGIAGEIGGVPGELLVHNAVANFFNELPDQYYEFNNQDSRLIDDKEATTFLLVAVTSSDCQEDQFFSEELELCVQCPDFSMVSFSNTRIDLRYQIGGDKHAPSRVSNTTTSGSDGTDPFHHLTGIIVLTNYADKDFEVTPDLMPLWLEVRHAGNLSAVIKEGNTYPLEAQSSQAFHLRALVNDSIPVGVNVATVSWFIAPAGDVDSGVEQCVSPSDTSTFDVSLKIIPKPNEHHLGMMRGVGLSLMAMVWLSAIYFGAFVFKYRNSHIVNVMQPLFLSTLCLGIFIMASSIFPLSFDDGIMPESSCHAMCILFPWLLSTGFVLVFSALFSKLWRINQLFHAERFHRVKVTEKDVLWPFAILFSLNLGCLILWTAVDPLQWSREYVNGEEWESYGTCESDGIGYVFLWLIVVINFVAILLACYQAWKARDISDEFSESKYLGLAIFTWLQVSLVGLPSIYLVEGQNYTARYFLKVGLIFVMSETMLLVIFIPLVLSIRECNRAGEGRAGTNGQGTSKANRRAHVSGLPAHNSADPSSNQRSWQSPQAAREEEHPS